MADTQRPEFDILDVQGKEYKRWVSDVENTFIGKRFTATIVPPEDENLHASPEQKAQALMFLRRHIHPTLKKQYLRKTDPKELWDILKDRFDNVHDAQLPDLLSDWEQIRLLDFDSVQEYHQTMLNLQSDLSFCGVDKTDDDMMEKTFTTFPESASMLSHQYRDLREKGTIKTFSDLMNVLQRKERYHELILTTNKRPRGPKFLAESHQAHGRAPKPKSHPRERQAPPPPRAPRATRGGRGGRGGAGPSRNLTWKRDSGGAAAPRGGNRFGSGPKRGGYASNNASAPCFKCGSKNHFQRNCKASRDIQAAYKKHKQYIEQETNYVGDFEEEEYDEEDTNFAIDDFQPTKKRRTQEYDTPDYE